MWRSIGERNIRRRGQVNRAGGPPGGSLAVRAAVRSRRLALALTAPCALLALAVVAPAHSARAAALHDSGTVHIVVPSGNNGSPAGPVGTYVTVQASGLTPNSGYKLGVALQDAGCQGGFTDLGQTATADSTGSFVTTFQWPDSANATGSSYVVCAQSQADNSFDKSDSAFTVLSAKSPSIAVKRVAPPAGTSTPTAGSTQQPLPNGVFQAGGYVQIAGRDFLPGGTALAVYLTTQQIKTAQDVQSLTPLPTADGSSVSSNGSGSFAAIVQIPAQTQSPAQYYLYVTSTDGDSTTKAPPSLEAYKPILVEPAPAPTATPTNTPTPTVTATTATGGGGTSSTGGTSGGKPTEAIIALGVASILLFIVGVILLASAATTPRQAQR